MITAARGIPATIPVTVDDTSVDGGGYFRGGDATSPVRVFRGPLFAIDYRCPSYLAGEARSFLREHAIFCSLAALSRGHPRPPHCRSPVPRSHRRGRGGRLRAERESRNPQVQIVCIVRGSPMILAIILNSEESATKGSNDVNGAAPSPLASWRKEGGDGRFLPLWSARNPLISAQHPSLTKPISRLPPRRRNLADPPISLESLRV